MQPGRSLGTAYFQGTVTDFGEVKERRRGQRGLLALSERD